MKTAPGIVRWLPLVVALAACSPDMATAPEAVDSSLLVTAQAKGGNGKGTVVYTGTQCDFDDATEIPECGISLEYDRLRLVHYDGSDIWECQVNGYEDGLGGKTAIHADGDVHVNVTEPEAYVLVRRQKKPLPLGLNPATWVPSWNDPRWEVAYLGRGRWDGSFWENSVTELPYSWNSTLDGVVVPITEADITAWAQAGVDFRFSTDESNQRRSDLAFVGLGPIATETSAEALIDNVMAERAAQAAPALCRALVTFGSTGQAIWIPNLSVVVDEGANFPGKFRTFLERGGS